MTSEKTLNLLKKEFDDPKEAEEYAGKYLLRRWTWGSKNRAISQATKIDLIKQESILDTGEYQNQTLAQCLISAPFEHSLKDPNMDMIDNLPCWLGDILIKHVRLVNRETTVERQKNS